MALSIGDINFGLDADTKGLQEAVKVLKAFRVEVSRANRSSAKGAQEAARQLGRQESAMKRAFQQVLNLNSAIRRSGGNVRLIADNTKAFRRLQKELVSGKLSAVEFMRAMDAFNARLNRSSRALKDFNTAKARKDVSRFNEAIRDLESASVLAVGPLSGLGARIRALGAITTRSTLGIAAFLGAVTGVTVAFGALTRGAFLAGKAVQQINAGFLAATGSATLAKREFQFVLDTSKRLGVNVEDTAKQFSQLVAAARGTVLEGQGARDIFEGIATAAAALKLQGDQVGGMFKAVTQIISKGTVQAEELRGQLGERLPGAFQIAAKALGVTTRQLNDMLSKGEVLAEDLLPKLAQELKETFGTAAQRSAAQLSGNMERFRTAVLEFNIAFDETVGVTETVRDTFATLTSVVNTLRNNLETVIKVAGAVTGAMLGLAGPAILKGLGWLLSTIRSLTIAMVAFNAATMANPLGALASIVSRVALAAAGAAAGFWAMGRAIRDTSSATQFLVDDVDRFIRISEAAGRASKVQTEILIDETKKRISVLRDELKAQSAIIQRIAEARRSGTEGWGTKFLRFFGISEAKDASRQVVGLRKEIQTLETTLERLNNLPTTTPKPIGPDISDELDDAKDTAAELVKKLIDARSAYNAIAEGGEAVQRAVRMGEAIDEMDKLTADTLPAFEKALKDAGIEGGNALEQVMNLLDETDRKQEVVDEFLKKWEKTPEIMREARDSIFDLKAAIMAMEQGPQAFEDFEDLQKRTDKVRKFRESLEKTALSQEEVNKQVREYKELLEVYDEAAKKLEKQEEAVKAMEKAFEKSFDRVATAITDTFVKGGKAAIDFRNIVDAIVADIIQMIIELEIINPIKDQIARAMSGSSQPGAGGFFDSIFNLFTGGFGGGGITPITDPMAIMATGPELFFAEGGFAKAGMPHIVGEQGPELFIPGRSGTIVPNDGIGGKTVNIQVNNNFTVQGGGEVSPRSQAQIAAAVGRAINRAQSRVG